MIKDNVPQNKMIMTTVCKRCCFVLLLLFFFLLFLCLLLLFLLLFLMIVKNWSGAYLDYLPLRFPQISSIGLNSAW